MMLDEIKAPKKYALNGGPFGSKLVTNDYVPDGVPVIRGSNLSEDTYFSFEDLVFVSEEKADELKPNNAHPGDIIFTQRGTLGQVGIIPRESKYDRFVISQSQMKLTVDETKADPYYVYYYFKNSNTIKRIKNLAFSSGVPHINLQVLREFEIDLPSLPTQRKIAAILSAYDDLIENNTRRIKILEEMAQALYREWFVHFRFPGHEKVRMVDSPLGRIPEGWEVKRLGDIAQEVRRIVKPGQIDPGTPYFGLEHLPRKSIALSEWDTAKNILSAKLIIKRGEILLGKIRPYFHKVGVAPVDGICSSDIIILYPQSPEYFSIVLSCVSNEDFVNHATQTSKGTKMPRADWGILANYGIVVPTSNLLSIFNEFIIDIVLTIIKMIFQIRNLRATRDLLLLDLFSEDNEVENLLGGD